MKDETYYQIYNEDCKTTMMGLSDKFVQCVITSPPYNMLIQTKYNKYIRRVLSSHKENKYKTFDDALKPEDYYQIHKELIGEMLRVSNVVLYNFQIVTGSKEAFFRIIGDFHKEIKDIIIWDKQRCLPASKDKLLNSGYEFILVMEDNARLGRTINHAKFDRCKLDNILRVKRKKVVIDGVKHNAVFPEELTDILVEAFSEKGDIVYDPFMGTGTTMISALKKQRQFIGSEIDESYCNIAQKRLLSQQQSYY